MAKNWLLRQDVNGFNGLSRLTNRKVKNGTINLHNGWVMCLGNAVITTAITTKFSDG